MMMIKMTISGYSRFFWRRKATFLGVFGIIVFCLICFQYSSTSSQKSNPRASPIRGTNYNEVLGDGDDDDKQYLHKKLQESTNDLEIISSSNNNNNDPDAFDPVNRGVHFIPGVPGHTRRKLPKPEPKIHSDEIDYYKERNKLLYEAKAKETKAKSKMNFYIGNNLVNEQRPRGDLQPQGDENVEYGNGNLDLQLPKQAPIYYNDIRANSMVPYDPTPYIPNQRLVHFDLKGAPPKINYLKKILQMSKNLGATGVLMEYEDMLPFTGKLAKVAAGNHYTKEEIQELLDFCEDLDMDVIPLVQTFGHLEFVLKLPEFAYLRDVPEMPESICPCHKDAMDLVQDLVDQTMAFHPKAKYLHIGCDEVFHLGECTECQGQTRTAIFVDHVTKVAQHVRETYNVKSIIWDDMLRNFMTIEMDPLKDLVEPMLWVYAENVYQFMPSYTIERYAEVFDTAWTASAFKGAHGPTLNVPDVSRHLTNNLNWLDVMKNEKSKFRKGFQGIALTGWQRYDHFAVLAEILPVGIPSLAVDLVAVTSGFFNSTNQGKLLKELDCVGTHRNLEEPLNLDYDPFLYEKMSWCYFPGSQVFKLANNLNATKNDVEAFVKKVQVDQAWITDFNVRRNYSTPFRLDEGMDEYSYHMNSVTNHIRNFKKELGVIFDEYTVAEYIEQKVYPLFVKLKRLKDKVDTLRLFKTWPKRPLPILEDLTQFGIGISAPSDQRDQVQYVQQPQQQLQGQSIYNSVYKTDDNNGQFQQQQQQQQQQNAYHFKRLDGDQIRNQNYKEAQLVYSNKESPKRLIQAPDYYRSGFKNGNGLKKS